MEVKLFDKWALDGIEYKDISLQEYITLGHNSYVPHSAGCWQRKRFRKAQCPIVERLANSLMMHGRNSGKKLQAIRIIQEAFEIIELVSGENPVQTLIRAIEISAPREDSTRIGKGGVVRRQAVDVSPLRRINISLYLLATGARIASFRKVKSMAECLADEIMKASKDDQNSYAVKKRGEVERMAMSNR